MIKPFYNESKDDSSIAEMDVSPPLGVYDMAHGALWGAAMGDALGSPFEHRRSISEYTGNVASVDTVVRSQQWQRTRTYPGGQVTDDTEMMIAALCALVTHGGHVTAEHLVVEYVDWGVTNCPFGGKNTRKLFYGYKQPKHYQKRVEKYAQDMKASQSNGCLMRCIPFALVPNGVQLAGMDARLTNDNDVCQDAVQLYISVAKCLLNNTSIEARINGIEQLLLSANDTIRQPALQGWTMQVRDVTGRTKGWVLHGLYSGLLGCAWALKKGMLYPEIMRQIISLKGDADTNACIAGGLVGLVFGMEAMTRMPHFTENVEHMRKIVRVNAYSVAEMERLLNRLF